MARKNDSPTTSKKEAVSNKITFTGTMHSVDFDVMCRIKLKRICQGYSQKELAFLLGRDKDYISAKEQFKSKRGYTLDEINRLAFILEYNCPSFVSANPGKNTIATYIGSETKENGKIYHEVQTNLSKILFKIEEDDTQITTFLASEERQLARLKVFIDSLCEIGYFLEVRTPFQIFLCCSRTVPGYINPRLVEKAINHLVQQKEIKQIVKGGYISYISTESNKNPRIK